MEHRLFLAFAVLALLAFAMFGLVFDAVDRVGGRPRRRRVHPAGAALFAA